MIEGNTRTLSCKVDNDSNSTVFWYKDDSRVATNSRRFSSRRRGRKLDIMNARRSDGGVYTCRDSRTNITVASYILTVTGENIGLYAEFEAAYL